jgi:hypothetical protein
VSEYHIRLSCRTSDSLTHSLTRPQSQLLERVGVSAECGEVVHDGQKNPKLYRRAKYCGSGLGYYYSVLLFCRLLVSLNATLSTCLFDLFSNRNIRESIGRHGDGDGDGDGYILQDMDITP